MTLTAETNILFYEVPDPIRLREVAARAFDVPLPLVNLRTIGDLAAVDPASRVQLIRHPEPLPGDFAAWYHLNVAADLVECVDDALDVVAGMIRTVALSEADDDGDMTIHLPDGSRHVVRLAQDDDDAFRITPEMRRLIDEAADRTSGIEGPSNSPMTTTRARKVIAS